MSLSHEQQAKFMEKWERYPLPEFGHKHPYDIAEDFWRFALEANPPSRWVSVKEKLPNEEGEYFVMKNCCGCKGLDTSVFQSGEWLFGSRYITHWMENPPTPEESK